MIDRTAADQAHLHFLPHPAIENLGVIGDRRTSATIAADGTVCWMCLPRFDADAVFGCLLDLRKGGYWRLGPAARDQGEQAYVPGTAVLTTRWATAEAELVATDFMPWPMDARPARHAHARVVIRRLECTRGARAIVCRIVPRQDFCLPAHAEPGADTLRLPGQDLGVWCSHALDVIDDGQGVGAQWELREGDVVWVVLHAGCTDMEWTAATCQALLDDTTTAWRDWSAQLVCDGPRAERIRLSAIMALLFSYAPTGAVIAAPTLGLPERVPGEYNYDYRYCWIRDAALTSSLIAQLGDPAPTGRLLDFLAARVKPAGDDPHKLPLQVMYRIDGGAIIPGVMRPDIAGYRNCQPVQIGNPVYQMHELDSFGYLADCASKFVEYGGTLTDAHWAMLHRCADFIAANWDCKDAGIWELMPLQQFTSTRVTSWVVMDRTLDLAERLGRPANPEWTAAKSAIHSDVMRRGWNDGLGSFTQVYGGDSVDAALLLIPLLGFLPPDHPRVRGTVETVARVLSLDGLVHRFVPQTTPGRPDEPLGDKEGAFLMCSFWLSQAWLLLNEPARAEAVMARAEAAAGPNGLFSEAGDSRNRPGLLGNTPLLFSQVEYARAARALHAARKPKD